jgi:cytochrome c biogenesis protein CcdA
METLLNHLSHSLSENPFLAYLGVFIGGIFSSSSPCVLATIPLVIGYVGGYSEGDHRKAPSLSQYWEPLLLWWEGFSV